MKTDYEDILSRISDPPRWWDENGTPRYDHFSPHLIPDVYAGRVALLRIACQSCGQQFDVAMSESAHGAPFAPKTWHYGDPPRHNGCPGCTMNCDDLAVIEAWERAPFNWIRHPELEGVLP